MALFFDKKEKEYLHTVFARQTDYWLKDKILAKLKEEEDRSEKIKHCKHKFGEYIGAKKCCTKCETFGVGMGFSWSLKKRQPTTAGARLR